MPRTALLVLTAALAALALLPATTAHAAARGCGTVRLNDGASVHVRVLRGPVRCTTARSALKRYFNSTAPCARSSCLRTLGRWTCQTAGYHDFPRLATCNRKRRRIAAYSLAD